jgi:CRISPR-associated protein Cst1
MLKYTGHPLIDVGVATVTAFADKRNPADLTAEDMYSIANFMASEYPKSPYKSFLSIAFTSNAWFIQDAYNPDNKPNLAEEKRQEILQTRNKWASHHLLQWGQDVERNSLERDAFTGQPAVAVELSGKLPPGRAGRAQVPLLAGDENINFYANGSPGIAVSGETMLCLQALPLGCAKCGGKLLLVHSDNGEIMLHYARAFLQVNRRDAQLAQLAGSKEMPGREYTQRTLLLTTLLEAKQFQRDGLEDGSHFSITAYHLSNSGQGPGLTIYHLPFHAVDFLREMGKAEHSQTWQAIVGRAWEREQAKKKKLNDKPFQPKRNWLYEDLFDLDQPDLAKRFVRTYFLRVALRRVRDEFDPRGEYSLKTEIELLSWKITAIFLRRILNMEPSRVEQIRNFADQLAGYVNGQNDRRFFREFYTLQNYNHFRAALIKANIAHVKRGNAPIVTLDPYIEVFEEGDEVMRRDWQFARDLVLIRMVEKLYALGWLNKNSDALPEPEPTESEVN